MFSSFCAVVSVCLQSAGRKLRCTFSSLASCLQTGNQPRVVFSFLLPIMSTAQRCTQPPRHKLFMNMHPEEQSSLLKTSRTFAFLFRFDTPICNVSCLTRLPLILKHFHSWNKNLKTFLLEWNLLLKPEAVGNVFFVIIPSSNITLYPPQCRHLK